MTYVLGVPPAVLQLQQQGLLERAFHDGLFPMLSYRAEAQAEEWPANTGTEVFMTRPGLLPATVEPNVPGRDPLPQSVPYEQWSALLAQYTNTIDVDMPTSVTANASLFLRNIHQLGLQAGQSINRVARNVLFKSYLSGQTNLTVAAAAADTSIAVASLNGFTDVVTTATVRPQPVSTTNPLPITIGSGSSAVSASVVGVVLSDPTDPSGPGQLLLAAAVGSIVAIRAAVKSRYAPTVIRAAGGDSVDAVGPNDTLVLQQVINAAGLLRQANVQPHEDGFYHAHISPTSNAQVFADPVFQRLNQSLPEHVIYKEGFIGTISGVMFFMNSESPNITNVGATTSTGTNALYAREIGAEIRNNLNVEIGRVVITGRGTMYERWLNESAFVTEAGVTGKIGEFDVINNGIQIMTERIRLVLRAPIDRLQQKVGATWSISTSFPIPSDITATSGNQRYKRAVVLEFAAS